MSVPESPPCTRSLARRVRASWTSWVPVVGILLGGQQIVTWQLLAGPQPNVGTMTFAAALVMLPRTASSQQSRNEKRGGSRGG